MAIWQFYSILLPKEKVVTRYNTVPATIDYDDYSTDEEQYILYTPSLQLIVPYINLLMTERCHLLQYESWNPKHTCWGEDEGNRFEVYRDSSESYSLRADIDVRSINSEFVTCIIEIAEKLDCLLYTKNLSVISPQYELLLEEIRRSRAYAFCIDPYGFLDKLS